MGRPPVSDEELAQRDPHGFDHPPERLRAGGNRQPVAAGVVVVAATALLFWQPWGSVGNPTGPNGSPTSTAAAHVTDSPVPAPTFDGRALWPVVYTSITDNEWTVVALLAPTAASTEEPATQHAAAWSPGGPFLVLQQGLIPLATSPRRPADQRALCATATVPRERNAVPLPAGRVLYLGVTVPGSVPRPTVTASFVGGSPAAMRRAESPVVQLAGMDSGRHYTIPSSGPGAAILFALTPIAPLPAGTYRFEVASPGEIGTRYLFACVAP